MAKLIFVSCGQRTLAEKRLGSAAYVHIYEKLASASGAVFLIHPREMVVSNGWRAPRASVWIQQEIAILSFLRQREGLSIPVLAFKAEGVELEGASQSLILNARPLESQPKVPTAIARWLTEGEFAERPGTLLGTAGISRKS